VTGDMLILETKGQESEQDHVKWKYLAEWVQAVNQQGGFGRWRWDVAKQPGDVLDILAEHCAG
jgi:type III restriction enzyme